MNTCLSLLASGLLLLALLSSGCTSPQTGTAPQPSPAVTPAAAACGFTSCTGPDLSCGMPARSCPASTSLSDKCRQYATCDSSNGSCRLVTSQQYNDCRNCMNKCGGADATEILTCEEKC